VSDSSDVAAGRLPLEVEPCCAPRSAAIAPKNAITAAATITVFAFGSLLRGSDARPLRRWH
jgi:hypothetical protein